MKSIYNREFTESDIEDITERIIKHDFRSYVSYRKMGFLELFSRVFDAMEHKVEVSPANEDCYLYIDSFLEDCQYAYNSETDIYYVRLAPWLNTWSWFSGRETSISTIADLKYINEDDIKEDFAHWLFDDDLNHVMIAW